MFDDARIAAMSPHERRSLAGRLVAGLDAPVPDPRRERRRRRFVLVAGVCSLALVPWIVFLAITLPHRYVAAHWTLTWVGFDVGLLAALIATTVLAWLRRRAVVVAAAVAAALLLCDAWFDITTSHPGGLLLSIGTAVVLELPLAALLLWVVSAVLRQAADPGAVAGRASPVADRGQRPA